jgi:hypothetical protein
VTVPAYTRTWKQYLASGSPGVRIPFVSVTDAAQNAMYQWKQFLVSGSGATTPFTLLWSAAGGTGPSSSSDHTDRWSSSSAVTPQASSAGASQAWCILVGAPRPSWATNTVYAQGAYVTANGNVYVCRTGGTSASSGGGPSGTGVNITDNTAAWQYMQAGTGAPQYLIAYQGASADVFRISVSPAALFTLAGTSNNQPTATDEQVICSATSIVNATASADRILHLWASDDGNAWRMVVLRSGAMAGPLVGGETVQDTVAQFPVNGSSAVATLPCNSWGFSISSTTLSSPNLTSGYSANSAGGLIRALVSGTFYSCQCTMETMMFAGVASYQEYTFQPELAGGGFLPWPLRLETVNATGARGPVGNLIDWWACAPSGRTLGDGFGPAYQWWQLNDMLMPNPSAQAPILS